MGHAGGRVDQVDIRMPTRRFIIEFSILINFTLLHNTKLLNTKSICLSNWNYSIYLLDSVCIHFY